MKDLLVRNKNKIIPTRQKEEAEELGDFTVGWAWMFLPDIKGSSNDKQIETSQWYAFFPLPALKMTLMQLCEQSWQGGVGLS